MTATPVRPPDEVIRAVAVLEQAAGSVPAQVLPALGHPDVRAAIQHELDRAGRTLVIHRDAATEVAYASGYADDVAAALTADGFGTMPADQAAVLALVLLHSVAIPAAQGRAPVPWSAASGVTYDQLDNIRDSALSKTAVRAAVSDLDATGLLHNARAAGIRPGPALDRLTPTQRRTVELGLLALAAPDDPVVIALVAAAEAERSDPAVMASEQQ